MQGVPAATFYYVPAATFHQTKCLDNNILLCKGPRQQHFIIQGVHSSRLALEEPSLTLCQIVTQNFAASLPGMAVAVRTDDHMEGVGGQPHCGARDGHRWSCLLRGSSWPACIFVARSHFFFGGGPVHNTSEPPVTELLPVSTFTGAADEAAHSVACANFHPLTFRFHRSFR